MKKDFDEVRPKFWDWNKVSEMMNNCYKAQRDMINKNISDALEEEKKKRSNKRKRPQTDQECQQNEQDEDPDDDLLAQVPPVTIRQTFDSWPFLFTYQGMLLHFETLTGVNLENELNATKSGPKWAVMLEFFKSSNAEDDFFKTTTKKMEKYKTTKPERCNELKALILMIVRYFKETDFVEIVEESVTMEVLNDQRQAPQYPTLTAPGKNECLFRAKKYFLGVDGEYYYSFTDFERGVCCVYMMYYIFNLDYAPETQISLEFMQRYIFNMDPPQGNKRPAKRPRQPRVKYSTKIIHDDVAKLVNKLNEMIKSREKENVSPEDSDSASSQSLHFDDE